MSPFGGKADMPQRPEMSAMTQSGHRSRRLASAIRPSFAPRHFRRLDFHAIRTTDRAWEGRLSWRPQFCTTSPLFIYLRLVVQSRSDRGLQVKAFLDL